MGIYNTNQQWTTYRILDASILNADVAAAAAIDFTKLGPTGALTVGASGAGYDVTFYGDQVGSDFLWDQNGDTNIGMLTLGTAGGSKGVEFIAYGNTNGAYLQWDQSANGLLLVGTATLNVAGAATLQSTLGIAGVITSTCKTPKALFIGSDSDAQGSGIELIGGDWNTSQGVGFYADDGGHVQTGYTETFTARYLLTGNVTGGASADVSVSAMHADLAVNASYDGKGGLSALWGGARLFTGKTLATDHGLGSLGGGHFSVDLDAGSTLATNSWVAPLSVAFCDQGASRSGKVVGLMIRKSTGNVGTYDGAFGFINGDGVCQGSAAGATQDLHLRVLVMTNPFDGTSTLYTIPLYRT